MDGYRPGTQGYWSDVHVAGGRRVVDLVHGTNAKIAIQLGHSGRKGSTYPPFHDGIGTVPEHEGGWQPVGAGTQPLGNLAAPAQLGLSQISEIVRAYADAAQRSVDAGLDAVEVHVAHGYLLSQFLSPLGNDRGDEYGGSTRRRARFLLETVEAVRAALPDNVPLLVRLSATDWSSNTPGGVEGDLERTVEVAHWLAERGVDLIDVSSGGNVANPKIPVGPGYQTRFAQHVRAAVQCL